MEWFWLANLQQWPLWTSLVDTCPGQVLLVDFSWLWTLNLSLRYTQKMLGQLIGQPLHPNAQDYTKKWFGNWICTNIWSDSIYVCVWMCAHGLVACQWTIWLLSCEHILAPSVTPCELPVTRSICPWTIKVRICICCTWHNKCCFNVHMRSCTWYAGEVSKATLQNKVFSIKQPVQQMMPQNNLARYQIET